MRLPGSGNEMWRKCIVNGGQMLRSGEIGGGAKDNINYQSSVKMSNLWLVRNAPYEKAAKKMSPIAAFLA